MSRNSILYLDYPNEGERIPNLDIGSGGIYLLGITEISELLEVAPATVTKWGQRGLLPEPDVELSIGRIWKGSTIVKWARETGRLPTTTRVSPA